MVASILQAIYNAQRTQKQAKKRRRKNQLKTGKEVCDPISTCNQRVGTKGKSSSRQKHATAHVCTQTSQSDTSKSPHLNRAAQIYSQSPQTPSNLSRNT
ncbi:hypothetical protein TNIN_154661 [Trichonephila inaurata madagascariensis]|uniref:Uncharacterized protein n=1 Tax=Trichonephila inaurata madagascariensis TaxID=2747483 RepID=A0A8X6YLF0_9ARAC|nr:hypothetical protein TNIN_154661 [Trichonephila inaurata madagascariensis]